MLKKTNIQHGFTVVELLIVIVIIGILATITIVAYNGVQRSAAVAVLKSDASSTEKQLGIARTTTGSFPSNGNSLNTSDGTTIEYTGSATGYCFTVSSESAGTSFFKTNESVLEEGTCPGHTGFDDGTVAFDQPSSCPAGYIPVPGNAQFGTQGGFCVMKYEAKSNGSGGVASTAAGEPFGYYSSPIDYDQAVTVSNAACAGCHMVTEAEWLTIAHNVISVASNWTGGSVGSGSLYVGNSDGSAEALVASSNDSDGYSGTGNTAPSNQRRTLTLTNGEVIWDFAGNQSEWTGIIVYQPGLGNYEIREWNASGNAYEAPEVNPFPAFGTPAASAWNSAQGIGQLYSDRNSESQNYLLRGGAWNTGAAFSGIFALDASYYAPYSYDWWMGFRVAQ